MKFREALVAKLNSIPSLTSLVGAAIYQKVLPETHDLGRDGPALTWFIVSYPRGHHLGGSDSSAAARVQFSAWSYQESVADAITLALWNRVDGIPVNPWGDGSIYILSIVQQEETDQPEDPKPGTDQHIYQVVSELSIKHRTSIPTLA